MTDKEKLKKIADKLKEKQKLDNPDRFEAREEEDDVQYEDVDVKMYDDVFEHVMHKRHKLKKKNPDKIRQIEEDCNHINQTENLQEVTLNLQSIEDDFVVTDIPEVEDDFMSVPRSSAADDVIVTTRDVRLGSVTSLSSYEGRSSVDSLSLSGSASDRNAGSISRASLRSAAEVDGQEFNQGKKSSRQEVLKQMRLNTKKLRKERKEEVAIIEKQREKRREIAQRAKQETLRQEVLMGTYSDRLEYSLEVLLQKFEQDNNDDMVSLKSAMQLLSVEDPSDTN